MKHILITTIVAVVLVGCGSSVPDQTIHEAAHLGDIEAVKQHLAAGTDVNVLGDEDYEAPPLYWAAHGGHKEIVELLIANGANLNLRSGMVVKTEDGSVGEQAAQRMMNNRTPLDMALDGLLKQEIADLLRKHSGKTGDELKAAGK
ncbi:MAG TPA: ankyrin repeat domain-containing protein [Nitrospinaceae bacterium]|jgi:ankyrin repeat protein|nr:ankyrin repeat domain-containing protein [Nitrospinaceae bacterium]|tara:strand:+ start:50 stop:487 length:438 start_codon:yes stop_codon:yes gene_type:complete